jgi:hypothetical protein
MKGNDLADSHWTAELLNKMRMVGDPEADNVITTLFRNREVGAVNSLMDQLVKNAELDPAQLPDIVKNYLDQSDRLPDWADPDKIERGSQFFCLHGPEIVLLLFCASLPVLYANSKGAQVLYLTQRMTNRLHRRIVETAQFVLDVTEPGAFAPAGNGIRVTQKVRLVHAATRHFMELHPQWRDQWDMDWGIPINQTDLAGTMMSFSITVIQALEKSGVQITPEEKEGYLHLWKVVGSILGVQPELMPTDVDDAANLMAKWMELYHEASEAGRELTKVLLDLLKTLLPYPIAYTLTTDWTRFWIGDRISDILGVGPYNWAIVFQRIHLLLWQVSEKIDNSSNLLKRLTEFLGLQVVKALVEVERGDNRPAFNVPYKLRGSLGVEK